MMYMYLTAYQGVGRYAVGYVFNNNRFPAGSRIETSPVEYLNPPDMTSDSDEDWIMGTRNSQYVIINPGIFATENQNTEDSPMYFDTFPFRRPSGDPVGIL